MWTGGVYTAAIFRGCTHDPIKNVELVGTGLQGNMVLLVVSVVSNWQETTRRQRIFVCIACLVARCP